jgi:hypothetical protein
LCVGFRSRSSTGTDIHIYADTQITTNNQIVKGTHLELLLGAHQLDLHLLCVTIKDGVVCVVVVL